MGDNNRGTAVALGLFDGVHLGHQRVLRGAVELAGRLGLTPAAFTFTAGRGMPESKRGFAAITTEEEKERLMRELGVERIFCPVFEEFRALSGEEFVRDMLVGQYRARALSCGRDFRFGRGAGSGSAELRALCGRYGVELLEAPALLDGPEGSPVSSTRIRELLREGDIPSVNRMLGRRYGFRFTVVHGRRLGRRLDSPTINQPFPEGFALPRFGVYAAFAELDGRLYPAVTNVGVKPTVKSDGVPLAETWIAHLHADLYGRQVPVYLVKFQRPEAKFATVEELRRAIDRDKEEALRVCAEETA